MSIYSHWLKVTFVKKQFNNTFLFNLCLQYCLQFFLCSKLREEKEYISFDSIDRSEINDEYQSVEILTPDFLSFLRTSGLPNHRIKLKVWTSVMLLRNIDQWEGFCNGIRLIITRMVDHVLEAKIISGKNIGNMTYVSRIDMSPSQSP